MRWHSWLLANLSTLVANLVPRKRPVKFYVEDFMPGEKREEPEQTPDQMALVASVFAASGWGKMIDPKETSNN